MSTIDKGSEFIPSLGESTIGLNIRENDLSSEITNTFPWRWLYLSESSENPIRQNSYDVKSFCRYS